MAGELPWPETAQGSYIMKLEDIAGPPEQTAAAQALETAGSLPPDPTLAQVLDWLHDVGMASRDLGAVQSGHVINRIAKRLARVPAFGARWKIHTLSERLLRAARAGELSRR